MSKEKKYKIFSKSLPHRLYILKDSADNCLEFSRDSWDDCKLTMNGEDLVKTDIIKYQPFVVALNFAFETTLNNILFSRSRPFKFKVKGNYHIKEIKEIDWKWKYSEFWSTKFTLVDKNNNGKGIAKIDELVMTKRLFGSFTISNEVPSELHALILTSACLAVKDVHDSLNPNTDSSGINTYAPLFFY